MNHIFKWNGQYLGFINNGYLFDSNSTYLGWVDPEGSVWREDGHYAGELVESQYILRNSMKFEPMARMPKMPPMPPFPPMPPMPRMPKMPRVGWDDPFNDY